MTTQSKEMIWWCDFGPQVRCLGSFALTTKGAANITLCQLSMAEKSGLWPPALPKPIPAKILPLPTDLHRVKDYGSPMYWFVRPSVSC